MNNTWKEKMQRALVRPGTGGRRKEEEEGASWESWRCEKERVGVRSVWMCEEGS